MKNLSDLMAKAHEAQERIKKMQEKIDRVEVEGESGGGMVKIVLTCKGDAKKVTLDESLLNASEKVVLEDLLVAAFNDAKSKAADFYVKELDSVKESLKLPF